MPKTRLQSLRSLQSAEKHLKKALKKSKVIDRGTMRANAKIRKKARKELKMLRKTIVNLKKALGKSVAGKRKSRRRRRTKRKKVSRKRRTKRRRRTRRRRRR